MGGGRRAIQIASMVAIRSIWLCLGLFPTLTLPAISADARGAALLTRLHRCGSDTCLLIEGRRADARATVRVADHEVAASGRRMFRVSLPLTTVRVWSAPFARSMLVRVDEPGGAGLEQTVRLPIGLLGHASEIAELEIRAP